MKSTACRIKFFSYIKYRFYCKKKLSKKRYKHSLAVGKMLRTLMGQENKWLCLSLGLAHDIAHEWERERNLKIISENGIKLLDGEEEKTLLLHAPVGALLFSKCFPDLDKKYYKALRYHTAIIAGLDDVALNFFVADKIDKTRTYINDMFREKIIDEKNPEKRVLYVLKRQDEYLASKGEEMLDETKKYYNYLKNRYVGF